jgi:predicted transcriptional regulator
MATIRDAQPHVPSTEVSVLAVLLEQGPQTLDRLCSLQELDSTQALLAIDRLCRSGAVKIERMARCDYHVSLIGAEQG